MRALGRMPHWMDACRIEGLHHLFHISKATVLPATANPKQAELLISLNAAMRVGWI